MSSNTCPVCDNEYERMIQTDKEQLRIRTNNLGTPSVDNKTTGVGTTGTDVCVAKGGWASELAVYLH